MQQNGHGDNGEKHGMLLATPPPPIPPPVPSCQNGVEQPRHCFTDPISRRRSLSSGRKSHAKTGSNPSKIDEKTGTSRRESILRRTRSYYLGWEKQEMPKTLEQQALGIQSPPFIISSPSPSSSTTTTTTTTTTNVILQTKSPALQLQQNDQQDSHHNLHSHTQDQEKTRNKTKHKRPQVERAFSQPVAKFDTIPKVPIVTDFPDHKVSHGAVDAIPVRLQTESGLCQLLQQVISQEGYENTAVILDFDKVITTEPLVPAPKNQNIDHVSPSLLVRGGQRVVDIIRKLHHKGVPLFIATARRRPEYLEELYEMLQERAHLGYVDYFEYEDREVLGENGIELEIIQNEQLGISFKRIKGTRVFSGGYEKGKLVAHIAANEVPDSVSKIYFIDDNVFNAYFVLQESPQYLHEQKPGRKMSIVSSWWDPSEEQSRGVMKVSHDSDFSYSKDYQPCLSAYGVTEFERIRTAGLLLFAAALPPQA